MCKGSTKRRVFQRINVCTEPVREGKGVPSVSAARARRFSEVRCVREGAKGRQCEQELESTGHGV